MTFKFRQRPILAVLFLVFSLWCWQVFWWRHQAVQVTWFQIKNIMGSLSTHERLEWGAICNGLEDFTCASSVFAELLEAQPGHRLALSNYAIAEARRQNCTKALQLFETYRAGGQEGPETLYWGGRCLLQLKRHDEARLSFYLSTSLSPDATEAPEALVDLLFKQGLREEALSVVAALTEGRPSRSDRWREKFSELILRQKVKEAEIGVSSVAGRRALRVPCLDGQNFWMPVKLSAEASPDFVTIDLEQSGVTLNEEQLLQRTPAKVDGDSLTLSALQIGPWLFKNIDYSICHNCKSVIGRSLLDHFEVSEDMEASIRFLILTPN